MEKCFIIMPISTPEELVEKYFGDEHHFKHVLDVLFTPAIKEAGFEPIPPSVKGAEVIQAEIIKNLENADLVLCDISTLNPNVFFELGCRTAINKPVCYVKDDKTPKIPFDNAPINHIGYNSSLKAWELQSEIDALAKHIRTTFDISKGKNPLWKYFGATSTANSLERGSSEEMLGYILQEVSAIKQKQVESEIDLSNLIRKSLKRDLRTPLKPPFYEETRTQALVPPEGLAERALHRPLDNSPANFAALLVEIENIVSSYNSNPPKSANQAEVIRNKALVLFSKINPRMTHGENSLLNDKLEEYSNQLLEIIIKAGELIK